jgi:hypothetical protein
MDSQRQKQLVLILARQFASNLSTPTLIADARGIWVFLQRGGEGRVGWRFAEAGEMPLHDWLTAIRVGDPLTLLFPGVGWRWGVTPPGLTKPIGCYSTAV